MQNLAHRLQILLEFFLFFFFVLSACLLLSCFILSSLDPTDSLDFLNTFK